MIVVIVLGIFAVLFSWLESRGIYRHGTLVSFFLIFIFLSLRYGFGNDYNDYQIIYENVAEINWSELSRDYTNEVGGEKIEMGYIYLVKFFTMFSNFFFFVAVHSLVMCLTFYLLIKKYVDFEYAWIAVLIFVFSVELLMVELSAFRQSLAIFCFLFSTQFLIGRSFWKYALCIVGASFFHSSALVFLPLYFFFSTRPIARLEPLIFALIYIFIIFFGKWLLLPIQDFTESFLPKYISYIDPEETQKLGSGMGLMLSSALFGLVLFAGKTDTPSDRVFYRIMALYILLTPTGLILTHLSRLTLYFAPAMVVVIAQMVSLQFDRMIKTLFIILFLLQTFYNFNVHFSSPINSEYYMEYKTIFSAPQF